MITLNYDTQVLKYINIKPDFHESGPFKLLMQGTKTGMVNEQYETTFYWGPSF